MERPEGEPAVRALAMPGDTNPAGDVFGGWILSQMDIAGGIVAHQRADGRVATIAVEGMKFHKPVLVGDVVSCHCRIERVGRTSLTIQVETWVRRGRTGADEQVTEGRFTYVAIDEHRQPREVPPA